MGEVSPPASETDAWRVGEAVREVLMAKGDVTVLFEITGLDLLVPVAEVEDPLPEAAPVAVVLEVAEVAEAVAALLDAALSLTTELSCCCGGSMF